MKKLCGLICVLVIILAGCSSSSSKLDEIISDAKDDKEAFQLILDYANKNVKYHKRVSQITYVDNSKSKITDEVWNIDGEICIHGLNVSDFFYQETLISPSKRAVVSAFDFENDGGQGASYQELTEEELPSSKQIFKMNDDVKSVKKKEKDNQMIFTVTIDSQYTEEDYIYEYTVNHDGNIIKTSFYEIDKDGNKTGMRGTESFTDINKDVELDEDVIEYK